MGERKVLTKYYPPDFDPTRLPPKRRTQKDGSTQLRFMLPISIRCLSCGCFMGRGLKFYADKHLAPEKYLGIKIYRFSMKCIECGHEFWIRTNPKDATYETEKGAKKNFEAWAKKEDVEKRELDMMEKLEVKVIDAQREIEELDQLEELKHRNDRGCRIGKERLMEMVRAKHGVEDDKEGEIDREARRAFEKKRKMMEFVAERGKESDDDGEVKRLRAMVQVGKRQQATDKDSKSPRNTVPAENTDPAREAKLKERPTALAALGEYGSDSESETGGD